MHLESLSTPMTIKNVRSRQGERTPIFRTGGRSKKGPQEGPTLRRARQRRKCEVTGVRMCDMSLIEEYVQEKLDRPICSNEWGDQRFHEIV